MPGAPASGSLAAMQQEITTAINYEAEFNNRARVPEHPEIMSGWLEAAAKWRKDVAEPRLDVPYGESARQCVDIFKPRKEKPGPIALFIHGGYWQALGRESFSHMARGANKHGVTVAVPSYDLCPKVTVVDIINQMRACCLFLWKTYKRKIVVAGHSAGGHLTAALMATQWHKIDEDVPPMLVTGGLAISGIYDLRPLVGTSLNEKLGLTAETAEAASPAFWPAPVGLKMIAAVGGEESDEFKRQVRNITHEWHEAGAAVMPLTLEGENHFTVIEGLADPDHLLSHTLVGLASAG